MTVHVYPENDWIEHVLELNQGVCDCLCEPKVVYLDEETGDPLPMPVVIHNAIDGREQHD